GADVGPRDLLDTAEGVVGQLELTNRDGGTCEAEVGVGCLEPPVRRDRIEPAPGLFGPAGALLEQAELERRLAQRVGLRERQQPLARLGIASEEDVDQRTGGLAGCLVDG